jgi:DNA anti-recombination protein RmuC
MIKRLQRKTDRGSDVVQQQADAVTTKTDGMMDSVRQKRDQAQIGLEEALNTARASLDNAQARVQEALDTVRGGRDQVSAQTHQKIDSVLYASGERLEHLAQQVRTADDKLSDVTRQVADKLEQKGHSLRQKHAPVKPNSFWDTIRKNSVPLVIGGIAGIGLLVSWAAWKR